MPTTYADKLANHERYVTNIKCLAAIYIYWCGPENIHSRREVDQSGVTVFWKSYANALSVFIACAALSSAEVHLRTLLQRVQASK